MHVSILLLLVFYTIGREVLNSLSADMAELKCSPKALQSLAVAWQWGTYQGVSIYGHVVVTDTL